MNGFARYHEQPAPAGNKADEFQAIEYRLRGNQQVIDHLRLFDKPSDDSYQGICW